MKLASTIAIVASVLTLGVTGVAGYVMNQQGLQASTDNVNNAIDLDWEDFVSDKAEPYTYTAYQKKEGSSSFQSISATDYSKVVKVLEVYPYTPVLEEWTDNYGKETLTTNSVSNEIFNENPSQIWDYDVVVLGFADSNNGKTLSDKARIEVEKFVDSGRGLLLGHDTVYIDYHRANYKLLAEKYLNMDSLGSGGWYNGSTGRGTGAGTPLTSDIVISKKGLLTKYPWEIGEVGTKLTIPYDHTSYQYAKGDVWMRFSDDNQTDPFNFYLTTWNNVAMIQTGHSIRSSNASTNWATEDEQKLVNNTLFYLAQLTTNTNLKDRSGMDVAAPTKPGNVTIQESSTSLKVNLTQSTEKGSSYSYYVEATGGNTGNVKKSNTVTIENKSGLAGYSYVIDDNPDTVPDGKAETSETNFTIDLKNKNGKYFHIAAVDKAGNVSEVVHEEFDVLFLETKVDSLTNAIDLDWNEKNGNEPFTYQAYQQKEGNNAFQTISATDLNKKVKVLNLYPNAGGSVTYTTWDGTTRTVPKAASAEKWMEEPNGKNSKGYGMGLIDVEPVSIADFNTNPNSFLKDASGEWKYDVIFLGSWDANNRENLNAVATKDVEEFILSGRGFLAGHDTIGYLESSVNFNKLSPLFNMEPLGGAGIGYTEVKLNKRGLLTSYPWNIGEIGDTLEIPMSHTLNHKAFGDVWMMFTDNTWSTQKTQLNDPIYNFYLTSWNNTAMIQTGHSNGAATNDEQMILANTMFYLAQLTSETELKDRSGMDIVAPTKPKNVKVEETTSTLKVSLDASVESGSLYNYYVEATGQNSGKKYQSKVVGQENKSGLAGYSYVIDNSPLTIPDATPETTKTAFTIDLPREGNQYFHIAAVDKAGNISEVFHKKFEVLVLTGAVDYTNNAIDLNWNEMHDRSEPYTYQVYQQRKGTTGFQSVSTTDLEKSKIVKALNIYPVNGSGRDIIPYKKTGEMDLAGKPMKNSAMLEEWIGEYGQGKITVDAINQNDFDANPDKYLKDDNGNYKYDVVAVGFWNLQPNQGQHLGDTGVEAVRDFTESGRGLLTGHHHIGLRELNSGMNQLRDLFGIKLMGETGWNQQTTPQIKLDYVAPELSKMADASRYWSNSKQVQATKRGSILEYPNYVAEEGRIFSIPETHNGADFVTGDSWVEFVNPHGHGYVDAIPKLNELPDGTKGSKNAYLSTFNNTALIQTGHSSLTSGGELISTDDEKKLVANTIFYLAQLTTETELKDRSGMDVEGPKISAKPTATFNRANKEIVFKIGEVMDVGSKYNYYVQGTGGNSKVQFSSNTIEVENKSGLAGYSYVVDNKVDTVPDNKIETTSKELTVPYSEDNAYLHIVAVDKAGNISDVYHYDAKAPTLTKSEIKNVTQNGYDVFVHGVTDEFGTIESVQFPTWTLEGGQDDINGYPYNKAIEGVNMGNGTWKYHVDREQHNWEFGEYMTHIYIYDDSGNVRAHHAGYLLKDLVKPVISIEGMPAQWTAEEVTLTVKGYDAHTGIKSITLPNGSVIELSGKKGETLSIPFKIQSNGIYTFTVTDYYGNTDTMSVTVSKIDTSGPIAESITNNPINWTNQSIALIVKAKGLESGIHSITRPDGSLTNGGQTNYEVHQNGNYVFILTDNVGNETIVPVVVTRIDKGVPTKSTIEFQQ